MGHFELLAVWGGTRVWSSVHGQALLRRAVSFALCALAVFYAARTVTRNRDWRSEEALILSTLAFQPHADTVRTNLGTIYWNRGDIVAAEREWLQALKADPNSVGLLRLRQKRYQEATGLLERATRVRPGYTFAHLNLGDVYLELGRNDEAQAQFRAAVTLSPLSVPARNRLGKFLFDTGRWPEAEEQFLRSVESAPSAEACDYLGDIYSRWGSNDRAEQIFLRAVSLDPFDGHVHFRLGALYAARGHSSEARREYEAGLQTDPNNTEALAKLRYLKSQGSDASLNRP